MLFMCLQLFEKLKLQESPVASRPTSKAAAGGSVGAHLPARDAEGTEQSSAGARLSDRVRSRNKDCATIDGKSFGKVHTRHIHQLFIRGENIVLVNPQRL